MNIVVMAEDAELVPEAELLAGNLSLPFVDVLDDSITHVLLKTHQHLQLKACRKGAPGAVWVDFMSGKVAKRAASSSVKTEAIAKAVGLKKHPGYAVLDATAGLGRDAFILAGLGAQVTLLESSRIVGALLADGLARARGHHDAISRMFFHEGDSIPYMGYHQGQFDVVYLDPMFPAKNKKALAKKEMQLLQEVVQQADDMLALFDAGMACARHRVVVKRPRLGPSLVPIAPSYCLQGQSNRFDIYIKE